MIARLSTIAYVLVCVTISIIGLFVFIFVSAFIILGLGLSSSSGSAITLTLLSGLLGLILPIILLRRARKRPKEEIKNTSTLSISDEKNPDKDAPKRRATKEEPKPKFRIALSSIQVRPEYWGIGLVICAVLFLIIARQPIPLASFTIPVNPNNLGILDRSFFFVGQIICETSVGIGWGSFFDQFCVAGNIFVNIPNYIRVGQFSLVAIAAAVFLRGFFFIW